MHAFLAEETLAVNRQRIELQGATKLWKVAEQDHVKATQEILRHPSIDPNIVRRATRTTPLHIAAYLGHHDIVRELLAHPCIDVNVGNLNSHASPLFVAAQQGHELVVEMLLDAPGIDVNKATSDGVTPLIQACSQKHEHIVQLLVSRAADLNVARTRDERRRHSRGTE
jgi:ankyrin repeat protein